MFLGCGWCHPHNSLLSLVVRLASNPAPDPLAFAPPSRSHIRLAVLFHTPHARGFVRALPDRHTEARLSLLRTYTPGFSPCDTVCQLVTGMHPLGVPSSVHSTAETAGCTHHRTPRVVVSAGPFSAAGNISAFDGSIPSCALHVSGHCE